MKTAPKALASVVATLLLSAVPASAAPSAPTIPIVMNGRNGCSAPFGTIRIGGTHVGVEFRIGRPAVHRHAWHLVSERTYCEPLFQTRLVGYDRCGHPLYRQVLIRAGGWTTVQYQVCNCGLKVRC